MAKVILDSTDTQYTIANNNVEVKGASGSQTLVVNSGVTGLSFDSTIEDVDFSGNVADYTFSQNGAGDLTVHDSSGNAIATISGANGKTLSFADGTVALESTFDATTATGGINLGGTAVGTTSAAVVPATIDATDISSNGGSAPVEGQTYTLTTAVTDAFVGTAGNDTIDGSTAGSLQTGDRYTDTSVEDNDVLNATVTVNNAAPTLTSVETINVAAKYGTGGIDLTNSSGYDTVNLTSEIASGNATVSNVAEAASIVAGTNISTLTVSAKATIGTNGLVDVSGGDATTVTLTGDSGADTFGVTLTKAGTLNMNGADAGDDTYTATLVNGTNAVALNTGDGTDTATLNLAGGTLTLTGNTSVENLNLASTGAANTVNATATVKTTSGGTITLSGDQDLTLKDTSANFDGVTVVDNNTANTKVTISGTSTGGDLSKITADTIEFADYTNTHELKIANGATLSFTKSGGNSGAVLEIGAAASTDAVTLDMTTDADVTNGSTAFATTFATINLSSSSTSTTAVSTAILGGSSATLNVTGSNAVTLENTSTAKAVNASALTGKLTAEATANLLSITAGAAADALTVANADFDGSADTTDVAVLVDAGAGDDSVTIAGISAITDTDTTITLDGGAGTDTLVVGATADLSANTVWKTAVLTGFETIDIGTNTVTLTQKQLFTNGNDFTIKGAGGTLAIKDDGASSKVFDLSGMQFEAGVAAPTITITGHTTEANTIVAASQATTIVGGSAVDTITGGAGADTITGGGSNDILIGGAGADNFVLGDVTTVGIDSISDLVGGTDNIYASGNATHTATALALTDKGAVDTATYTTVESYIATFAASGTNETVALNAYTFTYGSDKYLLVDNGTTGYLAGTDAVVKITGLTGTLVAGDIYNAA